MMRAIFAQAVDPIFEFALEQLAELERGAPLDALTLRTKLLTLFDQAESLSDNSAAWQLAKYALAAWIDEMLLTTPWDGATWWRDRILELEFFQTRLCSVRFFELAQQACTLSERDALEVFVNCVQLGFRGMYGWPDRASDGDHSPASAPRPSAALPSSIDTWLERMEARLDLHRHLPAVSVIAQFPQRNIEGAPPLPARQNVVWWSLVATILLLANIWAIQGLANPLAK